MKPLSVNTIRTLFLDFFREKNHKILPSFSLIPQNDPSILLINAGMTPMKNWFTGAVSPPSKRIATCQKCIRTPDIDNVGKSDRHATYFEMLGNFSFGDYFKKEAIEWAWEFCCNCLELPAERLYATVYTTDDEAYNIWHDDIGLPDDHIFRFEEDNFWEHGVGPCGPSSEIFFDRGPEHACDDPNCTVGCECDRYIEIWNLVFTELYREEDGSYSNLTQKNIDTGAGLERIAVVMQEVNNLFEVDTVRAILDKVCSISGKTYGKNKDDDVAIRVITDHTRSAMMMIADGINPSNEGRGYVLRRLIRRAVRYGRLIGIERPFMADVMRVAMAQSVDYYPELKDEERIIKVLTREEERFNRTLKDGLELLNTEIKKTKNAKQNKLAGDVVFQLHDTFGFPVDLTAEIAREENLNVDLDRFDYLMNQQKERARRAAQEKVSTAWGDLRLPDELKTLEGSKFLGYDKLTAEEELLYILTTEGRSPDLKVVDNACEGDKVFFVFAATPFYAEAGGQVGDQGLITLAESEAEVLNTQKVGHDVYLHQVCIKSGCFTAGQSLKLQVDKDRRMAIARNHTATHLLHEALRRVLGDHVSQKGSYVSADRLRFDFQHDEPLSDKDKQRIEELVNKVILDNIKLNVETMPIEKAKEKGAIALFGERYGEEVRVVSVGDFSCELCGGTHLNSTGEIALFLLQSEGGVAAGVRRIEAITGPAAHEEVFKNRTLLKELSKQLQVNNADDLMKKINDDENELASLKSELKKYEAEARDETVSSLLDRNEQIGKFDCILLELENFAADDLRSAGDQMRDHLGAKAVIVLASKISQEQVLWLAMLGKDAVKSGLKAGNLIRIAAKITGGGGGGRPDMAQGGGREAEKIKEALAACRQEIEAHSQK